MKRAHQQGEGRLAFWCPACNCAHGVRVAPAADAWGWNGSLERPTFTPSVRAWHNGSPPLVCHSFVRDGRIEFLNDCTHALSGTTVDLPAWPFSEAEA